MNPPTTPPSPRVAPTRYTQVVAANGAGARRRLSDSYKHLGCYSDTSTRSAAAPKKSDTEMSSKVSKLRTISFFSFPKFSRSYEVVDAFNSPIIGQPVAVRSVSSYGCPLAPPPPIYSRQSIRNTGHYKSPTRCVTITARKREPFSWPRKLGASAGVRVTRTWTTSILARETAIESATATRYVYAVVRAAPIPRSLSCTHHVYVPKRVCAHRRRKTRRACWS